MEHREVLAIIIAAFGVIALIGLMSIVRGVKKEPDETTTTQMQTTPVVLTQAQTDIWDVLNNQLSTTTTSTEQTDANGSAVTAVTGADGSAVTMAPGESMVDVSVTNPAESGTLPGETIPADTAMNTAVPAETATMTTEAVQNTNPGFTIIVN